jgi:hypothetical protein
MQSARERYFNYRHQPYLIICSDLSLVICHSSFCSKPFGAVDLNVNALAPQIAKAGHSGVSQREGENNTPFTPTNGVLRNQNSDSDQV